MFLSLKEMLKRRPFDIIVNVRKIIKFGKKSLTALVSKIWNQLPTEIKSEISFFEFNEYSIT